MSSDQTPNQRSRWWWLPTTISAIVASVRLTYEFLRDHFRLHSR
ncbi:hypothetical protein AB0C28_54815 [Nonomuraea sp. NPDC048892]